MGTKDSISGSKKGQVTEKIATKLTNYYSAALKRNAPHLTAMRNAVMASLHQTSIPTICCVLLGNIPGAYTNARNSIIHQSVHNTVGNSP